MGSFELAIKQCMQSQLTFPCMSSLIVRVTLSPPSTRLESISSDKSRLNDEVGLWSLGECLK